MATRIVLSREQLKKLRRLQGEFDAATGGNTQDGDAKPDQAPALEETRPYEVLTHGSIANRIRRPWGFER